ncbi:MAG: aldo/keto reductase [Bacteroidetes bacterium]|nr:aldo/keto reductase [Bacteroidota bacterium]
MKNYSRRKFIQNSAIGAAVVSTSGLMSSCSLFSDKDKKVKIPQRTLGKTGLKVSILSFGGGSQFLKNNDGDWEKVLKKAVESGINLFDTAPSYNLAGFNLGEGKASGSEERFGEILPAYRDKIILSTKLESRDPDEAKKTVETSLARMKTDYLDILMIHSIEPSDDVAKIEKGLYKEMVTLKESGVIKHIGFSCMDSAERSRDILEKLDFDVCMLAMNPTMYGDFVKVAFPAARKKNTGIIAMKVMRNIVGVEATAQELFEYAWTQEGVASTMVGHFGIEPLEENIKLAQEYGKNELAGIDRQELETRLAKLAGPHALCWARPGYIDGGIIA